MYSYLNGLQLGSYIKIKSNKRALRFSISNLDVEQPVLLKKYKATTSGYNNLFVCGSQLFGKWDVSYDL